jgi:putative ABC transport system permease protein
MIRLPAFTSRKTGLRKVLGASATHIVYLFSKEFTLLIGNVFLIAPMVAYYFMYAWLQRFVYRIALTAGIFLLTILVAVIIAWLTVGYQAIKAAVADLVRSLQC